MSKKLFVPQEKTRINLQLSKELKKELDPYIELHNTTLTQVIHTSLLQWLLEQKIKYEQLNK